MPYPDGDDLSDFLIVAGVDTAAPTAGSDTAIFYTETMQSVALDWERDTGFFPWLSSGQVTTRYLTPNGSGRFFLDTPALTVTSLKIGTSAYTLNTDYHLYSPNGAAPWYQIEWEFIPGGTYNSIAVEGTWGVESTLSKNIKRMLIAEGASRVIQARGGSTGVLSELKQGEVTKKYAKSPVDGLHSEYVAAVRRYGRIHV